MRIDARNALRRLGIFFNTLNNLFLFCEMKNVVGFFA